VVQPQVGGKDVFRARLRGRARCTEHAQSRAAYRARAAGFDSPQGGDANNIDKPKEWSNALYRPTSLTDVTRHLSVFTCRHSRYRPRASSRFRSSPTPRDIFR
jgi:hypothetical protein